MNMYVPSITLHMPLTKWPTEVTHESSLKIYKYIYLYVV